MTSSLEGISQPELLYAELFLRILLTTLSSINQATFVPGIVPEKALTTTTVIRRRSVPAPPGLVVLTR